MRGIKQHLLITTLQARTFTLRSCWRERIGVFPPPPQVFLLKRVSKSKWAIALQKVHQSFLKATTTTINNSTFALFQFSSCGLKVVTTANFSCLWITTPINYKTSLSAIGTNWWPLGRGHSPYYKGHKTGSCLCFIPSDEYRLVDEFETFKTQLWVLLWVSF